MIAFLGFWLVCLVALTVTLGGLWFVYRVFGGDLELSGWGREAVIALVASLLQAGVLMAGFAASDTVAGRLFPVTALMLIVCYKATHSSTSLFEGSYAIV